jgi:hypothetical protein
MASHELIRLIINVLVPVFCSGLLAYVLVPRTRQKDQDDLIRRELWQKVQNLELKYEKLLFDYTTLNAQYAVLQSKADVNTSLEKLIETIKQHP